MRFLRSTSYCYINNIIKQFLCYVLADNSYADMCIGLLLFWLISKIRQAYDPPHFTTVLVHLSVLHVTEWHTKQTICNKNYIKNIVDATFVKLQMKLTNVDTKPISNQRLAMTVERTWKFRTLSITPLRHMKILVPLI